MPADSVLSWLPDFGGGQVHSAVFTVTPHMARELLVLNTNNIRNVVRSRVNALVSAITTGNWVTTHQGIALSKTKLLDGQHRLHAIVEAGIPVQISVTWNLPDEASDAIDIGQARTNRQICRDVEPRHIGVYAWLWELFGLKSPRPFHIRLLADSPFGEALRSMLLISPRIVRRRATVPIQGAVALRYLQDPDYIATQWKAYMDIDFLMMTSSVQALFKQLTDNTARVPSGESGLSGSRNQQAARAWVAFDPKKPDMSRITVRDPDRALLEMMGVYNPCELLQKSPEA